MVRRAAMRRQTRLCSMVLSPFCLVEQRALKAVQTVDFSEASVSPCETATKMLQKEIEKDADLQG